MTVVPGASYKIEAFGRETTNGFCSMSLWLGNTPLLEFARVGTSYTSVSATVEIPLGGPAEDTVWVIGLCSLPGGNPAMYDLFIDDATMTLVV